MESPSALPSFMEKSVMTCKCGYEATDAKQLQDHIDYMTCTVGESGELHREARS